MDTDKSSVGEYLTGTIIGAASEVSNTAGLPRVVSLKFIDFLKSMDSGSEALPE
jgi:hypothetical protein